MIVLGIDFSKYTDENGILVQNDRDGGDSCQREGSLVCLTSIMDRSDSRLNIMFHNILLSFEYMFDGILMRHPFKGDWTKYIFNTSRDQTLSLLCACATSGHTLLARRVSKAILYRLGFHQNLFRNGELPVNQPGPKIPDCIIPQEIGIMIRACKWSKWYWLLPVLDIFYFVDLICRKFQKWDYDINLVPMLCTSVIVKPTTFSILAFIIYFKKCDWKKNVEYYNSIEDGGNGIPPMAELYTKVMNEIYINYRNLIINE